ncbi:MAG: metal ABC transporter permease [Patescibacteria group bacterium]|nr:MAG: metal ABC transporter permease [Patescibacteria group bacterium]
MSLFTVFLVALSITESVYPYFFKLFVDAIPLKDPVLLLTILLSYVGIRLLKLAFDLATYFSGDSALLATARDIRVAVFKKIQDLDFAYHLTKSTGSMISAIKRGDLAVFNFFHMVNINLVRALISFTVLLVLFAQLKLEIAGLMLCSMILNSIFAYFLIKRNVAARVKFNDSEDEVSDVIVDNLINFETVKFFAKERAEYTRLGKTFVPWMKALWGYANSFRAIDIVIGVTGNASLLAVLYFGLQYLLRGQISTGEYIMILGFVDSFYGRFFDLVFQMRDVAKNNADLQSYFNVFNSDTLVKDPQKPVEVETVEGEIVFDNVNFSYPEGKGDAIKDLTFKIEPGESVALVGRSGAGKTTITKLLMRFYDPVSGAILIDGIDIRTMTKSNLRSFMGIVPQEPVLFNESIAYNIGYGAGTTDITEIAYAAKMANLDEFIKDLPEGYDTKVGERGVRLSGGQKQRLAIARMILSNPDIIIFDEATSQLDSQSEKLIQDAFWKVSKNKTTLIIAHRLSSITKADRIIVMDNGQIAEMGTHKALLAKEGLYAKFWKLQTVG